jgi:hypothetical protein
MYTVDNMDVPNSEANGTLLRHLVKIHLNKQVRNDDDFELIISNWRILDGCVDYLLAMPIRRIQEMIQSVFLQKRNLLKTPIKTRTLYLSEPYNSRSTPTQTARQPRKDKI